MKKLSILLIAIFLLQSCASRTLYGAGSGMWVGSTVGGALGGIFGGHRGYHLGTMVGVIAGAAAGAVAANSAERSKYDEYVEGYNNSSRNSYRDAQQLPNSSYSRSEESEVARQAVSPLTLRNLRFIDNGGNQVINRGEDCKIIFELCNSTANDIYDVVPYVCETNGNSHVFLSPSTRIEVIKAGDVVRYTCSLRSDKRLSKGTLNFRISVSYSEGDFVTLREFSLASDK